MKSRQKTLAFRASAWISTSDVAHQKATSAHIPNILEWNGSLTVLGRRVCRTGVMRINKHGRKEKKNEWRDRALTNGNVPQSKTC
jgi:hypothetical protein